MSSRCFNGGLITAWLLLSCRLGLAIAPTTSTTTTTVTPTPAAPVPVSSTPVTAPSSIYLAPQNPATMQGQAELTTPLGATQALPTSSTILGDTSTTRKFYTLTASLREIYDDNVNTNSSNKQASFETDVSPSVLVDFPDPDGDFSARYTFSATYYSVGPSDSNGSNGSSGNGGSSSGPSLQFTHDLDAQYQHSFSDRFNLGVSEEFRYDTQPDILQSTGTNYQNGPYITNILNANLTEQWTPLIGGLTSFSDSVVHYEETSVSNNQDNVLNSGTEVLSYAILPKVQITAGALLENSTYQTADRGYTTITGFTGGTWQILPSLSLNVRGGATYIIPAEGQDSIAPYALVSASWEIGAKSTLSFNYSHQVSPSDQVGSNGQISDQFSANFTYAITPRLSTHLNGIYTASTITDGLQIPGQSVQQDQDTYALDTGLIFQYDSNVSFDTGITLSGVTSGDGSTDSDSSNNNYTRDEAYVGIRGTY